MHYLNLVSAPIFGIPALICFTKKHCRQLKRVTRSCMLSVLLTDSDLSVHSS